jgi:hypothetical protein
VKVADGFWRAVMCHLRRDFGAVLRVRAENATKKGLHGTRKTPLIFALQAPSPGSSAVSTSVSRAGLCPANRYAGVLGERDRQRAETASTRFPCTLATSRMQAFQTFHQPTVSQLGMKTTAM